MDCPVCNVSLMERLATSNARAPGGVRGGGGGGGGSGAQGRGLPCFMLTHQYRMHPDISQVVSSTFYNNRLITGTMPPLINVYHISQVVSSTFYNNRLITGTMPPLTNVYHRYYASSHSTTIALSQVPQYFICPSDKVLQYCKEGNAV
jgi:hypothetical protein